MEAAEDAQCASVLGLFRQFPELLSADGETIQLQHLTRVLQTMNAAVFSVDVIRALCKGVLKDVDIDEPGVEIPLAAFVRSIILISGDVADAASGAGDEALRVRKLNGDVALALCRREVEGMAVSTLRDRVLGALGAEDCEAKLVIGGRQLDDDEEAVELLIPSGKVLEVTAILQNLPKLDPSRPVVEQLDVVKRMLFCAVDSKHFEGAKVLRKLLSTDEPPIDAVIALDVLPRLVEFSAEARSPGLQFEAMWALTNVASGTAEHTGAVVAANAVPVMVAAVADGTEDVREQAVWALGNIAGDSAPFRDIVLQAGALAPMSQFASSTTKLSCRRNATWAVSNLCRGRPHPPLEAVVPLIPVLAVLLQNTDDDILSDACWAVSYISDGEDDRIQAVVESGMVGRLVELLSHQAEAVQKPALRAVGNVVTGNDALTQAAIDAGALPALQTLLGNTTVMSLRKEVCWSVSNVAAGTEYQIQAVIDSGLMESMIAAATTDEPQVRSEALWTLSNGISRGSQEQVAAMVQMGCTRVFMDAIRGADARCQERGIHALDELLNKGSRMPGENVYASAIATLEGVAWLDDLEVAQGNVGEIAASIRRTLQQCAPATTPGRTEDEEEKEDPGSDPPSS
mmetsp:Transcript_66983/g.187211  ORF Transcript_66983/g.187211 Transcript_66983/m.187211 type:complete len:629 (+) Transcript_66983:115-2001(+)